MSEESIPTPISELDVGTGSAPSNKPWRIGAVIQGHEGQTAVLQSESHSFTPETGWTTTFVSKGPVEVLLAEAKKQIKEYKEDDYRVTADVSDTGSGFGTLTVRQPSRHGDEKEYEDEDTVQWSLTGNDMEKDILTHWSLENITDNDWDILRELKADQTATFPEDTVFNTAEALDIAVLMRKGVQTHSVSQWVLRRSSVLMTEQTTQTQIDDVGYQFTKAKLEEHESLPSELKFALPADGVWMKRTPSVSLEGTRYKVDGEFWHSDYASTVLYPVKT